MLTSSLLVALGAALVAAVPPLEVKDSYFVNPANNERFEVVGVAYQPGGSAGYKPQDGIDPLSNGTTCLRDAALMQVLGINAIRVYNLDPDLNHDECASIFNAAGMYMLIDVNAPQTGNSLTSYQPWTSYYKAYLNRTFAVVEAFKNYQNTLLFFSGNEVIFQDSDGADVPPYVRAVTRDLKTYISKHSKRTIPVGYSAADVRDILFDTWNYLTCTTTGSADDISRADLFALNSYSWCGNSSFTTSSYDKLISGFTGTSVPVFFSEYGCNKPAPRIFTEVPEIYSSQMTGVMSGGIVYEYVQEVNDFGLVDIQGDGSVNLLEDFWTLQARYAGLDFTTIEGGPVPSTSNAPPQCTSSLIKTAGFNNNFTIPAVPNDGSQQLIDNGVSPAPVGQFVTINDWTVKQVVRNTDGTIIKGLAVNPLSNDAINKPGTNSASGSRPSNVTGSSTTSSSPSSSSSNAAAGFSLPPSGPAGIPRAVVASIVVGLLVGWVAVTV